MFQKSLTKENILELIDDYTIFRTYCTPFKDLDTPFSSELREDPNPSCRITYDRQLWYKDFGNGKKAMDCFSYVMEKYSVDFISALDIINRDFNLGLKPSNNMLNIPINKIKKEPTPKLKKREDSIIKVGRRNWNKNDIEFWKQFGISKETLTFFRVFPIKYYIISNSTRESFISVGKYCYCFFVTRENSIDYLKIYNPFDDFKWITNCREQYQGYDQLPWYGDLLIITKSLKDVMVLHEFKYNAIAPQSENVYIDVGFYYLLQKRFNKIILFFDNDVAGIKASAKISHKYNIPNISLPIESGCKDISDYVKSYGFEKAKQQIKKMINGIK